MLVLLNYWIQSPPKFAANQKGKKVDHISASKFCASASRLAYADFPALKVHEAAAGISFVGEVNLPPLRASLFENEEAIFLAFRGTASWRDWMINFNLLPIKSGWGYAHRGFVSASARLWPEIEVLLLQKNPSRKPIYVTGHSLGGAIATVAALKLRQQNFRLNGLVTFGQPKVGALEFSNSVSALALKTHRRYVRGVDLVPVVPFYRHHNEASYFDLNGKEYKGVPLLRWPLDSWLAGWRLGFLAMFKLHSMDSYARSISAPFLDLKKRTIE
jgi:pimeloyl-ACP methyl ester carboxylesterase